MTTAKQAARFELTTPRYRLRTSGIAERVRPASWTGPAVAAEVGRILDCSSDRSDSDGAGRGGRPLVVGAIPFDTTRPAHLYLPDTVHWDNPAPHGHASEESPGEQPPADPIRVTGRDSAAYRDAVRQAVGRIRAGELDKIVLARTLRVQAQDPFRVDDLYRSLRTANPSAYTFRLDLPDGAELVPGLRGSSATEGPPVFLGASPELVLAIRGGEVHTQPLAGSAPRLPDPAADTAIGRELLASAKNRTEHHLVAQMVIDTVGQFSDQVRAPGQPELVQTPVLWHLGTPISGRLRTGASAMELLYALHPTPAVCGWPTAAAMRAISELEGFDRGLYAGLVGWIDAAGDGEWALALRSGIVHGASGTLYAGAGIVATSDPDAEHRETAVKFRTVASVLGHHDQPRRLAMTTAAGPGSGKPAEPAARIRADIAQVLGVDAATIADDDNLFDHGLDSMSLMALVETWDTPQRPLDFAMLLTDPRISAWATLLR